MFTTTSTFLLAVCVMLVSCQSGPAEDPGEGSGEETSGSGSEPVGEASQAGSGSGDSYDYSEGGQATDQGENFKEIWDSFPADTRRELAHQEFTKVEASKQFQMYLKALILEAKNMYEKNYLKFM